MAYMATLTEWFAKNSRLVFGRCEAHKGRRSCDVSEHHGPYDPSGKAQIERFAPPSPGQHLLHKLHGIEIDPGVVDTPLLGYTQFLATGLRPQTFDPNRFDTFFLQGALEHVSLCLTVMTHAHQRPEEFLEILITREPRKLNLADFSLLELGQEDPIHSMSGSHLYPTIIQQKPIPINLNGNALSIP